MPLFDVIACSVADAVAAEQGGARRLEIVRDLELGGLTPPLSVVHQVVSAVSIPVRVMLRESPGYEIPAEDEIQTLCRVAGEFAEVGVRGLVLAFLRGRALDLQAARCVLHAPPRAKATFHRAFEEVPDQEAALAALKTLAQFDRTPRTATRDFES